MKILQITCLLFFYSHLVAQELGVSIATWKNNAQGAYSIIHDDFGDYSVDGVWKYADTIAHNRGITFTIGAITSSCENERKINNYNNPYEYAKMVMIEQHGHELINHTHTHTCALSISWCNTGDGWADLKDYSQEIDKSTTSIFENTGYKPQFFIYPFDQFSNGANDYLKKLGYIGSRSGWSSKQENSESYHRSGYDTYDENSFFPDDDGFFRSAVVIGVNADGEAGELNENAQLAIDKGVWVNRELHNVGDVGWGHVPIDTYRSHLDFLQSKMNSGELWIATVSEILTYQIQKLNYTVRADYEEVDYYATVSFEKKDFDISTYLAPLYFKSPMTVNLDLSTYSERDNIEVYQGGMQIFEFTKSKEGLAINIYPSNGDLVIKNIGGTTTSLAVNSINQNEVLVYPNPSKYMFHLDFGPHNNTNISKIEIYDRLNHLIETVHIESIEEGFGEGLSSGIYFLRFITPLGDFTKKVVKI